MIKNDNKNAKTNYCGGTDFRLWRSARKLGCKSAPAGDSNDAGLASEGTWTATDGVTTTWTGCTTGLSIGLPSIPQISIPFLGIDFGESAISTNAEQIYP